MPNPIRQHRIPAPPTGTAPTEQHQSPALVASGVKYDTGKPRVGLVLGDFKHALLEVSKVGTFGAAKYSDHGWLAVPNAQERYKDALGRHLLADTLTDSESGLLHAAHAAWNVLAVLELMLLNKEGGLK